MRKLTLKALSLVMIISMIFMFPGLSKAVAAPNSDDSAPVEVKAAMDAQVPALHAYQSLIGNLPKDKTDNTIYPTEYGGEYIDGNKLIIELVGRTPEMEKKYQSLCGNSKSVAFVDASYSLNYLNSLDKIADSLVGKYQIVSYGVDRRNNKYLICVSGSDYSTLESSALTALDNNPIQIEASEVATSCSSLYGGDRITYKDPNTYYSVCIGGTYKGKDAILTAGHENEGKPIFYRSGTEIGSVTYQRCNTVQGDTTINSLGDFAIVTMNGNYTSTNKVRNATSTVSIGGTYSSVPVGTTIYKYGCTSGYSWGTVNYVNITVQYVDPILGLIQYEVRGLYQSSMQNSSGTDAISPGDSGGSVYMKDGTVYKIHGCVSGRRNPTQGHIASVMYSSPIYYAIDAGFTPRTK